MGGAPLLPAARRWEGAPLRPFLRLEWHRRHFGSRGMPAGPVVIISRRIQFVTLSGETEDFLKKKQATLSKEIQVWMQQYDQVRGVVGCGV